MLYDDLFNAVRNETEISDGFYENEIVNIIIEKAVIEKTTFLKCQLSESDLEGSEFLDITFEKSGVQKCEFCQRRFFQNQVKRNGSVGLHHYQYHGIQYFFRACRDEGKCVSGSRIGCFVKGSDCIKD